MLFETERDFDQLNLCRLIDDYIYQRDVDEYFYQIREEGCSEKTYRELMYKHYVLIMDRKDRTDEFKKLIDLVEDDIDTYEKILAKGGKYLHLRKLLSQAKALLNELLAYNERY